MSAGTKKNPVRTMVVRTLAGAVVGAAAMGLFLALVGDSWINQANTSNAIASVTGVVYVITGLMVWLGMAVPGLGKRFLNVEDADEIREESGKIKPASLVMILTGAFLLILAHAGSMGHELALAAAIACLAGIGVGTWVSARRYDELTRRMGLEASSLTLLLFMALAGAWGALAELGYVAWLGPLAVLSALAIIQLLAAFIVVGKRGMLMPR